MAVTDFLHEEEIPVSCTKEPEKYDDEKPSEREQCLRAFLSYLSREEKSERTIAKYERDVRHFFAFNEGKEYSKENSKQFKTWLQGENYKVASVNSMLASVNSFFRFLEREDCIVHPLRTQNRVYAAQSEELTKEEYIKLLQAAEPDEKMVLLLQTLAGIGIRISELQYITVESVKHGEITVQCKNKIREILLPSILRMKLMTYADAEGIESGSIFRTSGGKPLNRSNIWQRLKRLSREADVDEKKGYPHNFRKLFARTFYQENKDLAMLADVLGHSNINTTRIYIKSTCKEHKERLDKTDLVW